jgi:hypothetical protein
MVRLVSVPNNYLQFSQINQIVSFYNIFIERNLFFFSATCAVDGNAANTFDNNTYPIELGSCWHVMMIQVPKESADAHVSQHGRFSFKPGTQGDVAVLVRGSKSGQQKVSVHVSIALVPVSQI